MAHELILFGVGTSRTMRAHWMLLELGLQYESRPIQSRSSETLTDEFKKLNPRHKIPVLQHKTFVLTESAAIVQYLSETQKKCTCPRMCGLERRSMNGALHRDRARRGFALRGTPTRGPRGDLWDGTDRGRFRENLLSPQPGSDDPSHHENSVSVWRATQHSRYSPDDLRRTSKMRTPGGLIGQDLKTALTNNERGAAVGGGPRTKERIGPELGSPGAISISRNAHLNLKEHDGYSLLKSSSGIVPSSFNTSSKFARIWVDCWLI
jgi:hypothetical protein